MSRPSVAHRSLSLTEELERLEQSITLTLQEIDHNFSKAHRIVTTSILPVVEQYGENSRAVWDASKFWKQFFEASANVSLTGYEEFATDDGSTTVDDSTAMRDESTVHQSLHEGEDESAVTGEDQSLSQGEDSLLDDGELTGSTPRPPAIKTVKAELASLESPYEAMKREMKGEEEQTTIMQDEEDSTILFAQQTARLPDMSMTPRAAQDPQGREQSARRNKDPLLHRVLDKNYRVLATPHKPALRISPLKGTDAKQKKAEIDWQDSPMSSPEMAVPTLRSEAFMSPYKSQARQRLKAAAQGPRTPGVSVQTPVASRNKSRDVFRGPSESKQYEIDYESDGEGDDTDLYAGMSPPKTIQFALPPARLLQTPAREASKRIVDNILLDAGVDPESSEDSPAMVKGNEDVFNDSF